MDLSVKLRYYDHLLSYVFLSTLEGSDFIDVSARKGNVQALLYEWKIKYILYSNSVE